MEEQAADCLVLRRYLHIGKAHIVGHSYGGSIALQLTLDFPGVVQTLTLLEPALIVGSSGEAYRESLLKGAQAHADRLAEDVVDEFVRVRWGGNDYRSILDQSLPGAFEQAVADEIPGLLS